MTTTKLSSVGEMHRDRASSYSVEGWLRKMRGSSVWARNQRGGAVGGESWVAYAEENGKIVR